MTSHQGLVVKQGKNRPSGGHLRIAYFYRVNKHLLVCDIQPAAVFVLTALHSSMDMPERLAELEPTLLLEVEMLHRQLTT